MVCLDSDILIDFLRNDSKSVKFIKSFEENEEELCITAINYFEIIKGISLNYKTDNDKIIAFLDSFKIFSFDVESSKKAAEIFNTLKSEGEIIELADILIASVVMAHGETLATRNSKHFKRIKGLKLQEI